MPLFFQHFWILFILVTCANGFIFWNRAGVHIKEKPELREGYIRIIRGIIVYGNIPWLIMGIGMLSGLTHNMFEFFNPAAMNPIVLVFHFSIFVLWFLGANWIYRKGGAEELVRHPGFVRMSGLGVSTDITSTSFIKFIWGIAIFGGTIAEIVMWLGVIPFPEF